MSGTQAQWLATAEAVSTAIADLQGVRAWLAALGEDIASTVAAGAVGDVSGAAWSAAVMAEIATVDQALADLALG